MSTFTVSISLPGFAEDQEIEAHYTSGCKGDYWTPGEPDSVELEGEFQPVDDEDGKPCGPKVDFWKLPKELRERAEEQAMAQIEEEFAEMREAHAEWKYDCAKEERAMLRGNPMYAGRG